MVKNTKKRSMKDLAAAFNNVSSKSDYVSDWFPFFTMKEGETVVVRFLPDKNEDNAMEFLTENKYHVVNKKRVACKAVTGDPCEHCAEAKRLFDIEKDLRDGGDAAGADAMHKNAMDFYRKVEYIAQVYVVDPASVQLAAGKLVYVVAFGPKLFKVIQAGFTSGDLENNPCDPDKGYNFRIKKTKNGEFADYTTSSFSPKPSALDRKEALEQVKDLRDYLTKP